MSRWVRVPAPVVDGLIVALAVVDVGVALWDLGTSTGGVVTGALACVALVARRRFPLLVVLLVLPACLMLDLVVAPFAALFTLAERSRDRRLLALCAVLSAFASTVPLRLDHFTPDDRAWTVVNLFYALAAAAAPVLLGQLTQAHRDLGRRLTEVEEAREHERLLHAQAVLARERAQLAREMHDVVSHQVSLIAVQAGALQVSAQDSAARQGARTIRSLSVDTLDELRHMVTLLRASGGRATELTPQPTLADLQRLVATSGISAQLTGDLPEDISPRVQRAVYRCVQEALTNVRKHAPGATAVVDLWHGPDGYGVTVANTPPTRSALPLPGSGQGLVGLRERAELLDGTLEAGPTPGGGYQVRLCIPAH